MAVRFDDDHVLADGPVHHIDKRRWSNRDGIRAAFKLIVRNQHEVANDQSGPGRSGQQEAGAFLAISEQMIPKPAPQVVCDDENTHFSWPLLAAARRRS